MSDSNFLWVGWIFPVVGILLLLFTAISVVRRMVYMQTSEVADGEITEYHERYTRTDNGSNKVYHPVVRFQMKNGVWEEQTSKFGSSWRQGHVGQKVEVFYKPDNPKGFKLRAGLSVYLTYAVLLVLGSAFSSVGYFLLR